MGCSFAFVTCPMRVCRFRWIRAELSKRGARILFREHSFSAVATPLPFSAAVSFLETLLVVLWCQVFRLKDKVV